jgi:hypothetical protein
LASSEFVDDAGYSDPSTYVGGLSRLPLVGHGTSVDGFRAFAFSAAIALVVM